VRIFTNQADPMEMLEIRLGALSMKSGATEESLAEEMAQGLPMERAEGEMEEALHDLNTESILNPTIR
jgi:hypothetical protein